MRFTNAIDTIGKGVDVVGVATIVVGVVAATVLSLRDQMDAASRYRIFRKRMGRAILESAGVLAIIVAIRTILSFSLEVELDGRWPWSPKAAATTLEAAGEGGS